MTKLISGVDFNRIATIFTKPSWLGIIVVIMATRYAEGHGLESHPSQLFLFGIITTS